MYSQDQADAATLATVISLLEHQFGGAITLGVGQRLMGSKRMRVWRLPLVERPDTAPASVIVKQAHNTPDQPYYPDAPTIPAWTLLNEWASLHFLERFAQPIPFAPRFFGGDRAAGLVVMEDLGEGPRLDHLLLGADPALAETMLLDYAATQGRLQALTCGLEAEYTRLREALGPAKLASGELSYTWLPSVFQENLRALDLAPTPGALEEVNQVAAALYDPGPFSVFVQGDACPDNCIRSHGQFRLLDFEGGRFGHALTIGVYGRMRFPTCWCVYDLPADLPLRMEAAYRSVLQQGCLAAADDTLFAHAVCQSCAFWVLDWCKAFPIAKMLERDEQWRQTATVRQRFLARLDIVAQTTQAWGILEALGATYGNIAAKLRTLWPPELHAMSLYPAFQWTPGGQGEGFTPRHSDQ